MLNLKLELHPTDQPVAKPVAWFVPGDHPLQWLNEICKWKVEHSQTKLICVPRSQSDLRPIGVLAFGNSGDAESDMIRSPYAIPYGCLADRLYLPLKTELDPALTTSELNQLLLPDNYYVWHPICGLVVASKTELLHVSDLLKAPIQQKGGDWGFAHPGLTFVTRLHSLTGPAVGSIDDIMDISRGDIGDNAKDPEDWKQLLAETDEKPQSPPPVGRLAYGAAKIARWIAEKAPIVNGTERTWLNDLGDWASAKLNAASEHLYEQRHKELLRLQRLLENDPDQGLKYALPLTSGMSHRGRGPASGHLGRRNVDFHLGNIGRGGTADFWDVPDEIRQNLLDQYRQLALREFRLERYRRAAYIYAELLGDLNAAAKTLESGKHFREAAVIYREKLNRKNEAARCLEEGGLWQEAINQYRELDQLEKVGDLYQKLDLAEAAAEAYKEAVDQLMIRNDYVNAARIEETKLNAPQRALNTLEQAWPASSQAVSCLEQSFRILATLGQHHRTQAWFRRINTEASSLKTLPQSAQLISTLAMTYPDRATQAAAIATTQTIVSNAIEDGRLSASDGLLSCVSKLFSEDKLLGRDCRRYSVQCSAQRHTQKPVLRLEHVVTEIQLVKSIVAPNHISWTKMIHAGTAMVACGQVGDELWVIRIPWAAQGSDDSIFLNRLIYKMPTAWNSPRLIATFAGNPIGLVLHSIGDNSLPVKTLEPTDAVPYQLSAGGVASLPADVIGSCDWGHDRLANVRFDNSECILDIVNSSGRSLDSHPIESKTGCLLYTSPSPRDRTRSRMPSSA